MNKKVITPIAILAIVVLSGFLLLKRVTPGQDSVSTEMAKVDETLAVDIPSDETTSYVDISALDANDLIRDNPDLVIIDVSPLYDEGHIPGAINYYFGDGSLDRAIPSLDKEATYLVYCHSDSVSMAGAQKLIDSGFENVYRLEGNYGAWVDAGLPVEKTE